MGARPRDGGHRRPDVGPDPRLRPPTRPRPFGSSSEIFISSKQSRPVLRGRRQNRLKRAEGSPHDPPGRQKPQLDRVNGVTYPDRNVAVGSYSQVSCENCAATKRYGKCLAAPKISLRTSSKTAARSLTMMFSGARAERVGQVLGMKSANQSGSAPDDFVDDSGLPWAPTPVPRPHPDGAWAKPVEWAFRRGWRSRRGNPAPSSPGSALHSGPRWNNQHAVPGAATAAESPTAGIRSPI